MPAEDRTNAVHERLEEALRRLAEAQAIAHLGSWEWDVLTDVVTWSDEMYRIYGLEPGSRSVDFTTFLDFVHPDDRQLVDNAVREAFATASSFEFEHRIIRPDSGQRRLHARGRAIADESGAVIRMVGTGHDTTDQWDAHDQAAVATAAIAMARRVGDLQLITEAALTHLSIEELLPELLARVSQALGVDDAAVLLMDDDGETLVLRAARGLGDSEIGYRLMVGTGFGGRVARERRTRVIEEGAHESLVSPTLKAAKVESVIGVPLILRDRVIGVLHVTSTEPRRFTGDEIALVELTADRAAMAIDHARVYERERSAAETLQRALLPGKLPALDNIRAAARYVAASDGVEIGGDWYDVIPLPNGDVGLALGDVTGHGLEAAALMAQLRHGLRAYALDGLGPAEVADRVDALIHTPDLGRLATLVYAVISPDRWMHYVNAGHPPPLVIGADQSTRLLDGHGGLPVGCRHPNGYSSDETRLEPGDILILYSDGLVERRGETIDDGIARLCEVAVTGPAEPHDLVDHILRALLPGAGGEDDIALLAIRLEPIAAATG
jgi:sigma-B regulation protein RsbU (phosphoserine phosphatase)